MNTLATLSNLDLGVLALLGLMVLRGFLIGGVREACSLASLAGALLLVWLFAKPLGVWFESHAPFELAPWLSVMLAGALLGISSLTLLGFLGRSLRDWLRANNLGLLDRALGALLGATECALLVLVAVRVVINLLGADLAVLRDTHTFALYQQATRWFDENDGALKQTALSKIRAESALEPAHTALAGEADGELTNTPDRFAALQWLCETSRETPPVETPGDPELWEKTLAAYRFWCARTPGGSTQRP